MPLYMDRHDVSESVTAEHVAQLHQEDLKVQHQFGCRGLTYWFDGKRMTAFCLIEAPSVEALVRMHKEAHGEIPNQVIEVDPSVVESFLGRIEDPEKTNAGPLNFIDDPGFRIIMVVSLQRSSPVNNDPAPFASSLHEYNHGVSALLNSYAGKTVRQTENYFLVSFESPSNAVKAAIEITGLFKNFKKETNTPDLYLKIGLSAGVPVTDKQIIFGDGVKLAERMCKLVKGTIIVSPEVKELYDSENLDPLDKKKEFFCLAQTDEQFLTQLMDHTESIWNEPAFKVDGLNKPVGCSKSQLYRKMILLTGKSPNAFIREYRLQEALALLNKNGGNISEIAFETGFTSPSYFSKCFQKQYGHAPSDLLSDRAR